MNRSRIDDEEEEEEEECDEDDDELEEDEVALIEQRAYETYIDEVRSLVGPEAPDLQRDTIRRVCAVCPTRSEFTGWRGLIGHAETIRDRKKFVNRHRGYHRALVEVLAPNSKMYGTSPSEVQKMKNEVNKQRLRVVKIEEKIEKVANRKSRMEPKLKEGSDLLDVAKRKRKDMEHAFQEEIRRMDEDFERRIRRQKEEYEKQNAALRKRLFDEDSKIEKERLQYLDYLQRLRRKDSRNAQELADKLQAVYAEQKKYEVSVRQEVEKLREEHKKMEMDLTEQESKAILELQMQFEREKHDTVAAAHATPCVEQNKDKCPKCSKDFDGNIKRALLRPCGHAQMCMACAKDVMRQFKVCPHCKRRIQSVHLVFT